MSRTGNYKSKLEYTISIGITVHNRHETARLCIEQWRKFLPYNAKIFIVDDGSDRPFPNADFRFDTPQGISVAKNKCLELCSYADYIFLSDDDVFPISDSWAWDYISSGLYHACYTFGRSILNINPVYVEYEKPCGCLMFFKKQVIEEVGGFDTEFQKWGFEHVSLSDRIYNNGFTPARYIDSNHLTKLFHSMDEHHEIQSSVLLQDRINSIAINEKLYKEKFNSTEFKPYK